MNTRGTFGVEAMELAVFAGPPAAGCTGDDSHAGLQFRRDAESGSGHSLARRNQCELREAIEQVGFLLVHVIGRSVIRHFGGVRKPQRPFRHQLHWPNGATPVP